MKTNFFLFLLVFISICKLGLAQKPLPQRTDLNPSGQNFDPNWEFVKDRLFDGETKKVLRYNSDIHIRITGKPLKADTIIITGLIEELKKVISTNKILLVKTGGNLVLSFNYNPKITMISYKSMTGIGNRYEGLKAAFKNRKIPEPIKSRFARYDSLENDYSSVNFNFNDSLSFSTRKKYIEYEIIQSLCVINKKAPSFSSFNSPGPILGKPYWNNDPLRTEFNDKDKFLLSRLYSADFQEQFKKYMINSRSWLSYMSFVNKTFLRSLGISFGIIMAIIICLITYKPIFRRSFRKQYLNYLIRGIVISASVVLVQFVYQLFSSPFLSLTSDLSWIGTYILVTILNLILTLFVVSVLISTPLYLLEKLLIRQNMGRTLQSGLKMLFLLVMVLLFSIIGNPIQKFWPNYFIDFFALAIILSIGRGVLMYIDYSVELETLASETEISKLKEMKAKAEIQSLQSRINPHFLYNSLNSIAGLAHSDPNKVEKMALSLSDLFRYSINRKDEPMSTIGEEINMVRSYLEIEQIRFGERLSYSIEADKTTENMQIPKFIIQPLVENAVKHGVSKLEGKGEIKITINETEKTIILTVFDNGPAFPEGFISGSGLQSVYDLLSLICGGGSEVNWQNSPEKFIRIVIPVCKQ